MTTKSYCDIKQTAQNDEPKKTSSARLAPKALLWLLIDLKSNLEKYNWGLNH
jgi:hypothetical protein